MENTEHLACLLLGSNIKPEENIPRAVILLRQQVTILQVSSLWQTAAVGSSGPDFLNCALLISTSLDAAAFKQQVIRPLEAKMGRVRTDDKNAPRPIDIDILIFDHQQKDPALWEQAHRAVPAAELLPNFRSASGERLKDAALRLARETSISARRDISISPGQNGKDELKPANGDAHV